MRTRHVTTALASAALLLVGSGVAAADEHEGFEGQITLPTSFTLGEPEAATIELENTGEGDVTDITIAMTMRGYDPDELDASVEVTSGPLEGEATVFEFSVAQYTASLPAEGAGFTLAAGDTATIELQATIDDAPDGGQFEIVVQGERDGEAVAIEGFEAFDLTAVEDDDEAVEDDDEAVEEDDGEIEQPEEVAAGSGGLADTRTALLAVGAVMLLGAVLLLGGLTALRRPARR